MKLQKILKFAKTLIEMTTTTGDFTIDATVGNGNDTMYLANLVKENGKVFGFDIQHQAILNTQMLLTQHGIKNVTLFETGHEHVKEFIPSEYHQKISSAMFNLGYLPKGDHSITTKKETTLQAIKQVLDLLKVNGIIVLVIYSGHPEGKEEMDELLQFVSMLNQKEVQVLEYRFINHQNDAPFIIAIEKIK